MTKQLREIAYAQTRGNPSQIVFVEADEMTDAFQPVGDYWVEGDHIENIGDLGEEQSTDW